VKNKETAEDGFDVGSYFRDKLRGEVVTGRRICLHNVEKFYQLQSVVIFTFYSYYYFFRTLLAFQLCRPTTVYSIKILIIIIIITIIIIIMFLKG